MSQRSQDEYVEKMRMRYQSRGREGKSRLLDELAEVCGLSRKHAIKLMNRPVGSTLGRAETRGRKAVYGEPERKVLKAIWLAANQPCAKLLQPMLEVWLPHYERQYGRLGNPLRKRLKAISARSIDRLLAPVRASETRKRNSGTKPGTLIRTQIPIRTDNDDIDSPGYVEADTVAHCGGRLEGDFVWTVDLTDVHTQWTECRAVWNKGQHGVVAAIAEIEADLPFGLLGFDSDNGSEPERSEDSQPKAARRANAVRQFLNWHLVAYLQERGEKPAVAFTRSRPYRKNDNARVEQKNWTHARQLVGYDRLSCPNCVAPLNEAYRAWCLLKNFFVPVMKLEAKTRIGGKYRKQYDRPKTPAERVLEWEGITRQRASWIRAQQRELNPFELQRRVESSLKAVFEKARNDLEEEVEPPETPTALPSASLIARSPTAPGLFAQPKAEQPLSNPPNKPKTKSAPVS